MEEFEIYVLDGWGKGSVEGATFKGASVEGEERKIIVKLVRAFLKGWDVIGVWENKFGSYLIQLKKEELEVNDCGGWDHYYAYMVINDDSAIWVGKGLRQ